MNWRDVFDGRKAKVKDKLMPCLWDVGEFVINNTDYKFFAFNGRIFSINDNKAGYTDTELTVDSLTN